MTRPASWRREFVRTLPLVAFYVTLVAVKDAPLLQSTNTVWEGVRSILVSEAVQGLLVAAGMAFVETRGWTQRMRVAAYVIVAAGATVVQLGAWDGVMIVLGQYEERWPWWVQTWGNAGPSFVHSLLAIALYRMWRRARERAAALRDLQRSRAEVLRETAQADLLAMQARIDPTFLFDTLQAIDRAYGAGLAGGRRLIDALIDYLRAVLPGIDSATSTLGKECDLARAYLDLARERHALDLAVAVDVPGELRAVPFPPMLVLPLLDDIVKSQPGAARAGRIAMTPAVDPGAVTLAIDTEPPWVPSPVTLTLVRERLRELFAEGGSLTLRDSRLLLEVPHGSAGSRDR